MKPCWIFSHLQLRGKQEVLEHTEKTTSNYRQGHTTGYNSPFQQVEVVSVYLEDMTIGGFVAALLAVEEDKKRR